MNISEIKKALKGNTTMTAAARQLGTTPYALQKEIRDNKLQDFVKKIKEKREFKKDVKAYIKLSYANSTNKEIMEACQVDPRTFYRILWEIRGEDPSFLCKRELIDKKRVVCFDSIGTTHREEYIGATQDGIRQAAILTK